MLTNEKKEEGERECRVPISAEASAGLRLVFPVRFDSGYVARNTGSPEPAEAVMRLSSHFLC